MRTISLLPLLLAPALAFAQPDSDDKISYHYLAVGLDGVSYDVPGPDLDGSGYSFEYSTTVRSHIDLFVGFDAFDFNDIDNADGTRRYFGVGTHFDLTRRFSIFGRFGYLDTDFDDGTGNVDDDGGLVAGGLRYAIGKGWEIRGGAEYNGLNDAGDQTGYSVGADMYMTDAIALSLDATDRDSSTSIVLGLRFYFDKQIRRGLRN